MGPYIKREAGDGWEIEDGSGDVIASVDTEKLADGVMMVLLGDFRGVMPSGRVSKKAGFMPSYDEGVEYGEGGKEDEDGEEE